MEKLYCKVNELHEYCPDCRSHCEAVVKYAEAEDYFQKGTPTGDLFHKIVTCNCRECRPTEIKISYEKKPGKIARLLHFSDPVAMRDKINELVDRVNSHG